MLLVTKSKLSFIIVFWKKVEISVKTPTKTKLKLINRATIIRLVKTSFLARLSIFKIKDIAMIMKIKMKKRLVKPKVKFQPLKTIMLVFNPIGILIIS